MDEGSHGDSMRTDAATQLQFSVAGGLAQTFVLSVWKVMVIRERTVQRQFLGKAVVTTWT